MAENPTTELLRALGGPEAAAAWTQFLEQFSPVLRQVIVLFVNEPDAQADCFVYACEQLADNRFRRLRKFDPAGTASFATWLRAVVHRLCIDWRRKNAGRFQAFSWVANFDRLDQQIFRYVLEQGETPENAFLRLKPDTPGLTQATVDEIVERLAAKLTPRERWLLSTRRVRVDSMDETVEDDAPALNIPDLSPTPERAAMDREWQTTLAGALADLPHEDRLLIQMRFEQDLTLAEIARVSGLKDAQTADRRIRAALDVLRGRLAGFSPRLPGKAKAASV